MIVSNELEQSEKNLRIQGKFIEIAGSLQEYAGKAAALARVDEFHIENDYFTSAIRAIDTLWKRYQKGKCDAKSAFEEVQRSPYLTQWFSMLLCMILFGRHDGNELTKLTLPPESYLCIWKDKLSALGGNDSSTDGLGVYAFQEQGASVAGCCSDTYFVIPPKSMPLDENAPKWKREYVNLVNTPVLLESYLRFCSRVQKIILLLSADSMPDVKDSPLGVVKEIIHYCIEEPNIVEIPQNKIRGKRIGDCSFFSVASGAVPDQFLSDVLSLTRVQNKYYALYPVTEEVADKIEAGVCLIEKLKMTVQEVSKLPSSMQRSGVQVKQGAVTAVFRCLLEFSEQDKKGNVTTETVFYPFQEQHSYAKEQLCFIDGLPTFCMYPDISFKYERRCCCYTFFSVEEALIQGKEALNQEQEPAPEGNQFCFDDIFQKAERKRTAFGNIRYSQMAAPRHMIKVRNEQETSYFGCVLNLRLEENALPPLVLENTSVSVDMSKPAQETVGNQLYVYVDFGGSTSAIGYKTSSGAMQTDSISGKTPLVREVLAYFQKETYRKFVNLTPGNKNAFTVPSLSIRYGIASTELTPYHEAWQPFHYITDMQKTLPETNGKEMLNVNAAVIIQTLCETAVCHAVDENISELFLFPIFSEYRQQDALLKLWEGAIASVKKRFPDMQMTCMLGAGNNHLLFENMVYGQPNYHQTLNNLLIVNVNIGDVVTDMSAVFVPGTMETKYVCAYSSLQFAGRNLLKAAIANRLLHMKCPGKNKSKKELDGRKKFLLDLFGANKDDSTSVYQQLNALAEQISRCFYPKMRNKEWMQYIMPMLEIGALRTTDADVKFQADMWLRYGMLLAVIKDFISAALHMCDSNDQTTVAVYFSGGASAFLAHYQDDVADYLNTKLAHNCFVDVLKVSKQKMLEQMETLSFRSMSNGYSLFDKNGIAMQQRKIAPAHIGNIPGSRRSSACSQFRFRQAHTDEDLQYNAERFKNPECSMPKESLLWENLNEQYSEIMQCFLKESCYFKLLHPLLNQKPKSWNLELGQFYSEQQSMRITAFGRACQAEIYPEMLRSATYLFYTDRFLMRNYGRGFAIRPLRANEMDGVYQLYEFASPSSNV